MSEANEFIYHSGVSEILSKIFAVLTFCFFCVKTKERIILFASLDSASVPIESGLLSYQVADPDLSGKKVRPFSYFAS